MASLRQWVAWAEGKMKRVVVEEGLHVGLAEVKQGPLVVTFRLRLLRPNRGDLAKLLKLGPTFAQALQVDSVRVTDSARGILVEVPSPQPKTPPAILLAKHSEGLRVALGLDQWRRPAIVSLPDNPTILFVGPTRRGKTQAIKSTLYSLVANTPSHRLQYVIFSQKRVDWASFESKSGCLGIISDPGEAVEVMTWAAGEGLLASRARQGRRLPAFVIVLDDLLNLLKKAPQLGDPIGEIASMGGGVGVFQLIGTQDAGSKTGTGGPAVEANITARVVYRSASATQAARAAGAGDMGVEKLTGAKGDALLIVEGHTKRVATGYVDDRLVALLPEGKTSPPWAGYTPDIDRIPEEADIRPISDVTGYNRISTTESPPSNGLDGLNGRHVGGVAFPIGEGRPLTDIERAEVRRIAGDEAFQYRGDLSLSRLTKHVYGSKSPDRMQWVREALEGDEDASGAAQVAPAGFDGDTLDLSSTEGRALFDDLLQEGKIRFPEPAAK